MPRRLGADLNSVYEPHRRENHVGKISNVGNGGKSISVTNANNSQLRELVPVMPYGISSSPTPGLMSFVIDSGNSGNDGMVGVYDPKKPSCKPGECMMYSSGGATVKCTGKKVMVNDIDLIEEINKMRDKLSMDRL